MSIEGLYLTAVMSMTSVSVMMTVFILNLHYRGPKNNEVPFWLQQILSLSITNMVRTLHQSKKIKSTHTNNERVICKRNVRTLQEKQQRHDRTSANEPLLVHSHVDETKTQSRVTTNVSI